MGRGRAGSGVRQSSASSITIEFQYQGQRCRETIPIADRSPAAVAQQIRTLKGWREGVLLPALRDGTFDYAALFPESKKAERFRRPAHARLVGHYLDVLIDLKRQKLGEN